MTCEMNPWQDNNPYKRVVLNNVHKEPDKSLEMKSMCPYLETMLDTSKMKDDVTTNFHNIDPLDYRGHKDPYISN